MEMLAQESKMGLVPHHLRASSPQALTEAMLENNLRLKAQVRYQDIQYVPPVYEDDKLKEAAYWICWYYKEIDLYFKIKTAKVK